MVQILLCTYTITTEIISLLFTFSFQFFALICNSVIVIFVNKFLSYFLNSNFQKHNSQVKGYPCIILKELMLQNKNYLRLFSTNTLPTGWLMPVGAVKIDCCSGLLCSSVIMSSSSTPSSLAYCNSAGWVFLQSGQM